MNLELVYGGTFDPFHNGHEAVCLHVLSQTSDSSVALRVIPCARPALKQPAQANDEDRLAMLRQWRDSQEKASRIIVDAVEIEQGSVSYTAETIARLIQKDMQPIHRIWVLGADAFNSLARWRNCDALIEQLSFWVISRPGEAKLKNALGLQAVNCLEALMQSKAGYFWYDDRLAFSEASSDIRQLIDQQQLPVPTPIADYIYKHELYQASA